MQKKKQPAKKIPYKRKRKAVGDNEADMLCVLLQTIDSLSEDGKARCLSYIIAKYEKYMPLNRIKQ